MDLGGLRALALSLNLSAHGVPVTVTRPYPEDTPITTTGIWVTQPLTETRPYGTDLSRLGARRVMALPRSVLTTLPRGTLIVAPSTLGDATPETWRVDEIDRVEGDHWRATVIAAP